MNPNIEIKNEEISSPPESGSLSIKEIEYKLMIAKQRYKLLNTEMELSILITRKEINKLKRENEHLKHSMSRLEEDCSILKLKEVKNQGMVDQYLEKTEKEEKEFEEKVNELGMTNLDLDLALQACVKECERLEEDNNKLKRKKREEGDEEGMISTDQIRKKKREDLGKNAADTSLNSSIGLGQTNTEATETHLNDSHIPTLQAYKKKRENLLEDHNKLKRKEREDGDEEATTSTQPIRKKKHEDQGTNIADTSLNPSICVGQTNTEANEIQLNGSHILTLQAYTKERESLLEDNNKLKRKERRDGYEEGMISTHPTSKKKCEDQGKNVVDISLNSSISVGQTNSEANELHLNDSHIPTLQARKKKCESLLEDNNKLKRKEREDGDEGTTATQQIRKKYRPEDQDKNVVAGTSLNSSIDVGQTNTEANKIHSNDSNIPTPAENNDEKNSESHRTQKKFKETDSVRTERTKKPSSTKCCCVIDRVQITGTRGSHRRYTGRIARSKHLESALKRANTLLTKKGNCSLSFVKPMTKSNVSRCFWLGLPLKFFKENLSHVNEQLIMILEDEDGLEYESKCIDKPGRCGLSGGWRSFAIDHNLEVGDVLVFELSEPTRFKVYIKKAKPGKKKVRGKRGQKRS